MKAIFRRRHDRFRSACCLATFRASPRCERLEQIGRWYRALKASFTGAEPGPLLSAAPDLMTTRRGNFVYVHLLNPPSTESVYLHPFGAMPEEAVLLNTGATLACDVAQLPRLFGQNPPRCLRVAWLCGITVIRQHGLHSRAV